MYGEVSNTEDIVQTDDIVQRIDELEEARDILADDDLSDEEKDGYEFGDDEERELEILQEVLEEIGDADELINEDYFSEYTQQMQEEITGLDMSEWPYNRIDWDAAAEDLKMDYSEVSFDGTSFYYRA